MSVISEALKTAQRERSERNAPKGGDLQVLEGFFPFIDGGTRPAASNRRGLLLGGAVALVLVSVAIGAFELARMRHVTPPRSIAPTVVPTVSLPVAVRPAGTPAAARQAPENSATQPAVGAKAKAVSNQGTTTGTQSATAIPAAPVARAASPDSAAGRRTLAAAIESKPPERSSAPLASAAGSSTGNRAGGVVLEGPAETPLNLRVDQGIDAMSRGDYAGANEVFKSALSLGAPSRELYYNWALNLQRLGDLDGAATAFNKALFLDPTWIEAMLAYAALLNERHDSRGATAWLDKAMQLEPNDVHVLLAYANECDLLSDFTSERHALTLALAVDHTNATAHYNLARVLLLRLADTTAAVREFNTALRYAGSDSSIPRAGIQALLKTLPGGGPE